MEASFNFDATGCPQSFVSLLELQRIPDPDMDLDLGPSLTLGDAAATLDDIPMDIAMDTSDDSMQSSFVSDLVNLGPGPIPPDPDFNLFDDLEVSDDEQMSDNLSIGCLSSSPSDFFTDSMLSWDTDLTIGNTPSWATYSSPTMTESAPAPTAIVAPALASVGSMQAAGSSSVIPTPVPAVGVAPVPAPASTANIQAPASLPVATLNNAHLSNRQIARDLPEQQKLSQRRLRALQDASRAAHSDGPIIKLNGPSWDVIFSRPQVMGALWRHMSRFHPSNPNVDQLALENAYVQDMVAAKGVVAYALIKGLRFAKKRPAAGFTAASGYVYIYKDGGAIRRWTDGRSWTRSRKGGNKICIYRETQVPAGEGQPKNYGHEQVTLDNCEKTLFVTPSELALGTFELDSVADQLVGPLTSCPYFLVQGLVKRTFSVTLENLGRFSGTYTVVNYYNIRDVLIPVISPVIPNL